MSLNVRIEQVVGREVPVRALSFTCSGQWYGNDAFLANLDGRLAFNNRVVSEFVRVQRIHWPEGRARLWRDQRLSIELVAALSDQAIQFVEDARGVGDVAFQLEIRYQWHEAARADGDAYTLGAVHWDQSVAHAPAIARSRWLQVLAEMQWTEIEPGLRWLTGLQVVNHHTLADFRVEHGEALQNLFVQVLGILTMEKLVTLERVTVDGTKVRACVNKKTFSRAQQIREHLSFLSSLLPFPRPVPVLPHHPIRRLQRLRQHVKECPNPLGHENNSAAVAVGFHSVIHARSRQDGFQTLGIAQSFGDVHQFCAALAEVVCVAFHLV